MRAVRDLSRRDAHASACEGGGAWGGLYGFTLNYSQTQAVHIGCTAGGWLHCASALRCVKYTTHHRKSAYATKALQVHAHAGRGAAARRARARRAGRSPVGRRARGGSFLSLLPAPGREETITHSTPHTVLPPRNSKSKLWSSHVFIHKVKYLPRSPQIRYSRRLERREERSEAERARGEARP